VSHKKWIERCTLNFNCTSSISILIHWHILMSFRCLLNELCKLFYQLWSVTGW
jgi:hypothetical protein